MVWKVDLLWVGESVALHISRVGSDVEVRFGCDLVMVGVGWMLVGREVGRGWRGQEKGGGGWRLTN